MIGVAPQEVALYPMLTAAENLRFFGRIYGVQRKEIEGRIDRLLGLVGLEAHRNASAKTFSGGMQRRLNLAVALVHAPKLILLDEPTPGVDPQSREHIFEIIRRLRDAGSAVLYTTHYMEEAEKLCDRLGASLFGNFLDSNEMGKEAVGKPWDSFTPPQQKRFLILFRRLFERTYVDTLLLFERPNFAYLGETRFHGDVRVDSKIITPHDEFAVAYKLRPVGDRWMATNIKVENVNLTANLANQLDHLLSRSSVDDVLDLMQRKYGDSAS